MLALWSVCCIVLLAICFDHVAARPDEIYEQRAAGRSTSLLMGYTQTYFSNVFSPAL